jgi:hypothetical protein
MNFIPRFFVTTLCLAIFVSSSQTFAAGPPAVFARTNLLAWCIVPFDAKKRGPEERAQMLDSLGIHKFAYDWRAEQIPTFDAEIDACEKHHIEITAWWFPTELNDQARTILAILEQRKIHPQLWVMGGGDPVKSEAEQRERVMKEAARIRPIAEAAAKIGCQVALYNHLGWFGEPENQIAVIRELKMSNVGIVYNFHHGHEHIRKFPQVFAAIQPHLLAININGMLVDGDKEGKKILTLNEGDQELAMLRVVQKSGWFGPVGIINHRPELDAEEALRKNLQGLNALVEKLNRP